MYTTQPEPHRVRSMGRTSDTQDEFHFSDLPPWVQALALGGGVLLFLWALAPRWVFFLTIAGLVLTVGGLIWYAVQKNDGLIAALKAGLSTYRELHEDWETTQEKKARADPLTTYQKTKLKKAVGLECEVPKCSISRSLHVHHIRPRSEGGSNDLSNLIVLCRNHHADADAGSYSRSMLRQLTRGDRFDDGGIKEYWAKTNV